MAGSISSLLSKGQESMENARAGIDVAGHNISNAHTEGYSRQRINLVTKPPLEYGRQLVGDGARIENVTRSYDKLLEDQVKRESQNAGFHGTTYDGLKKIEMLFDPEMTSTVRDKLTAFTNALRGLSNTPEDASSRTNTLESAQNLIQAFQVSHSRLKSIQSDANKEIENSLKTINDKLDEIASLNKQIVTLKDDGSGANDLKDRQEKLIKDLSEMTNMTAYKDSHDQYTIRGPGESLLVEGGNTSAFKLGEQINKNGQRAILVSKFKTPNFIDVTEKITTGKLGGLIKIRDKYSQETIDNVNHLAKQFAQKFNEIHRQGYGCGDAGKQTGLHFFEGIEDSKDPAETINVNQLIVSNPNNIATAMSQDTPGDNVIVNKLIKMFQEPISSQDTNTLSESYDKFVSKLGQETSKTKEENAAAQVIVSKLNAQHEAVSGVSFDEETANIFKYHQLFNASSKLITTAEEMYQTILGLKR